MQQKHKNIKQSVWQNEKHKGKDKGRLEWEQECAKYAEEGKGGTN